MPRNTRTPFFDRLKSGLEEGIAHAKGELSLKTTEVPEAPPEIDAKTLVALREEASMTQSLFAKVLYVSTKTIQSWEQGVRVPSMSARRLIQIFAIRPEMVCELVGVTPVSLPGFKIATNARGKKRIVKSTVGRTEG